MSGDLYALPMRTGFSSTRIYMRSRPHPRCGSDRTLGRDMPLAAPPSKTPGAIPKINKRNTSVTSLIPNPAISALVRATAKVAGQAARRTLMLVSMFFEAVVEARAMMAQRQEIGSAVGAASNEKRHDYRRQVVRRL